MPSHYSHFIFAYEVLAELWTESPLDPESIRYLAAGAQGPDMFYHNQRSKPSGIALGSLIHRRGFGSFCSQMLAETLDRSDSIKEPELMFCLAYISHGILDRHLHPFVNYFSGWYDPSHPETERYRYAHAFYERIIDMESSTRPSFQKLRETWGLGQPGSRDSNFGSFFDLGQSMPGKLEQILLSSLKAVYPKSREDELLEERLRNAYTDARGFYLYCDRNISDRAMAFSQGEMPGIGLIRWTSLLHPPALPREDYLNLENEEWQDPCGLGSSLSSSLWDLWDMAAEEFRSTATTILQLVRGHNPDEARDGLAKLIGDSDLRNNHEGVQLCELEISNPRDLRAAIEVLDAGKIPADWRVLI